MGVPQTQIPPGAWPAVPIYVDADLLLPDLWIYKKKYIYYKVWNDGD